MLSYSEFNDDNKKRIPTIGKPKDLNIKPNSQQPSPNTSPPTFQDLEIDKQNRLMRVNELLNLNANSSSDDKMGNFEPIPNPIINKKDNINKDAIDYSPTNFPIQNRLSTIQVMGGQVMGGDNDLMGSEPTKPNQYSNYNQIYQTNIKHLDKKPYYSQMGISSSSSEMDKIWEKLNYMTHLLEEQQLEKTNNIMEEFILYTFLGVFIIYIVDSFTRSGKYVR